MTERGSLVTCVRIFSTRSRSFLSPTIGCATASSAPSTTPTHCNLIKSQSTGACILGLPSRTRQPLNRHTGGVAASRALVCAHECAIVAWQEPQHRAVTASQRLIGGRQQQRSDS